MHRVHAIVLMAILPIVVSLEVHIELCKCSTGVIRVDIDALHGNDAESQKHKSAFVSL